jgi:hypothetical protein
MRKSTVCYPGNPPDQVFRLNGTAAIARTLTVTKQGSGSGTVTSSPPGINCGPNCSAVFADGTTVMLTANPASNSTFTGWGGACSGTAACPVTMNADQTVSATFKLKPPNTKITKTKINQAKRKATFKFKAIGEATGFQCKLTRQSKKLKQWRNCSSPKRYKHLKPRRHTFKVRARGPGGKDPTPAKKKFRIRS